MHGVILDRETFDLGDVDCAALVQALETWDSYAATSAGLVNRRIKNAEVVVSSKVRIGAGNLKAAPRLALIVVAGTGTDNIDLDAASRRGVTVCNARNYATPAVVQHTVGLMLALATNLAAYHAAVRAGRWARSRQFCFLDYPVRELHGRSLGIIGHGALGRGVARAGRALGMEVLLCNRPGAVRRKGRLAFAELLARADVLSLHCPLSEQTRGLISAAELAAMKPDALLINTARGGIVDEAALADALRRGVIGGAAVDCLSAEPPKDGNPLLAGDIPNLLLTPHTAWGSLGARQRLADQAADIITAYRANTPRNVVAP